MIALPKELKDAMQTSGGPLRVCDPTTHEEFVVLRAEAYDRLSGLLDGCGALTQHEQKSLLVQAGLRAGWDDPAQDIYNDLVN